MQRGRMVVTCDPEERTFNLSEPHLRMGIPILRDLLLGSG